MWTYSVFDIPFIGIVRDEFVQLQFLILVFLRIQLLFLSEPVRMCVGEYTQYHNERKRTERSVPEDIRDPPEGFSKGNVMRRREKMKKAGGRKAQDDKKKKV